MQKGNPRGRLRHLQGLLTDWYGEEDALIELADYCPEPQPVSVLADQLLEKALPKDWNSTLKLQNLWPEIVGPQLAKVTSFVTCKDKIIICEVAHPLWLRELQNLKKLLINKIYVNYDIKINDITFRPSQGSQRGLVKQ